MKKRGASFVDYFLLFGIFVAVIYVVQSLSFAVEQAHELEQQTYELEQQIQELQEK